MFVKDSFPALRGSVQNYHRHNEFIWSLIFSMIVNLFIVIALVAQRNTDKPAKNQSFVVSIEARCSAFPRATSGKVRAITALAPTKMTKAVKLRTDLLMQRASVDPVLLPPENAREGTISLPVVLTTPGKKGEDLPLADTVAKAATTAPAGGTAFAGAERGGEDYMAPERLGDAMPVYPKYALRNGWEGRVLLTLWIDAYGKVEKVSVAETSGHDLLDRTASAAAATWRFKPARRNGIPVAETVRQEILFPLPLNEN